MRGMRYVRLLPAARLCWGELPSSFLGAHPPRHVTCSYRYLHRSSLLSGGATSIASHLGAVSSSAGQTGGVAPRKKTKTISPEEALLRKVNTLVGERDAVAAVRVVKSALKGEVPPSVRQPPSSSTQQQQQQQQKVCPPSATPSSSVVFSSKAFAAALYACEAAGAAMEGLALVAEVRRHAQAITSDWQNSEHVLFAILRLQCAADDREGATHLFAYLEQHGLLRLRSASVFLRYCCRNVMDRPLAFAVYEKALQHKIELTEPDYLALGTLCVRVREPAFTLLFILEEMKEHVPEVSETFVRDVLAPWIAHANTPEEQNSNTINGQPSPHYRMEVVDAMLQRSRVPLDTTEQVAADMGDVDEHSGGSSASPFSQRRGICPACRAELSGYPFTAACRTHLLKELREMVIPQACRSRRALLGFEHWRRYIHARCDSSDRVDIFIDGANLGYYGLSSWYDLAKKELLLHRGVAESTITAHDLDFNAQCKVAGKGVDVGVNFALIDKAVVLAVESYGLRRPLVMLHERHVEPRFMTPQSLAIVQRWRAQGWLYCSPTGLNDDLCWLYGALLMSDPTDVGPQPLRCAMQDSASSATAAAAATSSHRTFVCTNDKMRDHHFRLLSPRAFTRWRDRHRIGFHCVRVEDRTELFWELPSPYERCVQRHDAVVETSRKPVKLAQGSVAGEHELSNTMAVSTWHIPFSKRPVSSDVATDAATLDQRSASAPLVDNVGEQVEADVSLHAVASGDGEQPSSTETPDASPWVCITVTRYV